MKRKVTIYVDQEVRDKLDEIYAWTIKMGNKKSLSYIVSESIKVMHNVMEDTQVLKDE